MSHVGTAELQWLGFNKRVRIGKVQLLNTMRVVAMNIGILVAGRL